jgi:hypothetical protein
LDKVVILNCPQDILKAEGLFQSLLVLFAPEPAAESRKGVLMSRLIPAAERILRARALIQKARDLPVPAEGGKSDFSYIAQVKAFLQDARDLVKFIPLSPSASAGIKEEVGKIYQEADQANQEILH